MSNRTRLLGRMFRATRSRQAGVREGLQLATVQMPSHPLPGVVIEADELLANGTIPHGVETMLDENIHPFLAHLQLDAVDEPRIN